MAPHHKVALIQLNPRPLSPDTNFGKAAEYIRKAASSGADLAVLPEYHLTNWVPEDPKFAEHCESWQKYLGQYQSLAKECNICIVPGTIVEKHNEATTEEDILINVAYFIDNKGQILSRYQKKNLWHPERDHLTGSADERHEVFDTPLGKVGMLICWDIAFPEAFRELIAQGAKLIIIPTFWTLSDCSPYGLKKNPRAEALFLESTLTSRAFDNTCGIIFVNAGEAVEPKRSGNYAGLSRVTLPFIGALGDETKDTATEGMSLVDIDMEILEEAEKQYKVREDLARDDWHYVYRHDSFNESEGKKETKL